MATPIARPMTIPPPYPTDLASGERSHRPSNGFTPSTTFLADFKNILAQIADILGKFKAGGQNVTAAQDEFLNRFAIDNSGDDLLLDNRGFGLAHNIICQQIAAIILSFKGLEKTTGKNYIFPFTELVKSLNLSAEILAFSLSEFLGILIVVDTKFTDIQLKEKSLLDTPIQYVQFLTQQKTESELLDFLRQAIIAVFKFFQELGVDFKSLTLTDLTNFKEKISLAALLRFLSHYQQVEKEEITKMPENPDKQKLKMEKIYWPMFGKLLNKEAIKELKHTISEASSGKRNLTHDLWQKIKDQLSMKFSRDLKAEQDAYEIEELGKQLKAMIGDKKNVNLS